MMRSFLSNASDWETEAQKQEGCDRDGGFVACTPSEEEACERADKECRRSADEDVPGPGDVRNGDGTEMHGECSLPNPEVENEAADHADDSAELCCKARECAEKEDSEQ